MDNSFSSIHPELVCEWSDKNAPLTPEQITYGSKKLYWWKGSCGHEWKASAKSRSSGEKCPYCAGMRVLPGFNDLASKRPELVKEWSSKNKLKPTEVHWSSHKKAIWRDKYLPLKGMTQLTRTISKVQKQINPKLRIDGIVLTLVAENTNLAKTTEQTIRDYYGSRIKVFDSHIPMAIKCAEISVVGKSIYTYDGNSKVARAYESFTKEVIELGEKQRIKNEASLSR